MVFLSHHLSSSITIHAPPAFVRQTMLDFDNFSVWSHKYITSIKTVAHADKSGAALDTVQPAIGSKVAVDMTTTPTTAVMPVVANTEDEFAWFGGIPYIFQGRHSFAFKPSGPDRQSTEFIQSEQFNGLLTGIVTYTGFGGALEQGFKDFNTELKVRCESTYKA